MALNIRNAEAEALVAKLARLTGETKTEAVTKALRERLSRVSREKNGRLLVSDLDAIAIACASRPIRDRRTPDEILGHDDTGVQR